MSRSVYFCFSCLSVLVISVHIYCILSSCNRALRREHFEAVHSLTARVSWTKSSYWLSHCWHTDSNDIILHQTWTSPNTYISTNKYRVFQKELYNFESFTGIVYLDMLQEFLIPQLDEDDQEGCIHFQQDGAPPHYLGELREYLNTRFPGRWIGRAAPRSAALPMEVTLNHNYSR